MRQRQIEEYEINPCTMFIKPFMYGTKVYSQIAEIDDEYLSPFKPIEIIKKSCEYFGSSFEGRKEGTRQLIGITHKVPIVIDPTNFIYFFPTTSPNRPECIWISHEHVLHHTRTSTEDTLVTFRNKLSYPFPISYSSFENQLLRTALLRTKLMQRIEHMERKSFYFQKSKMMEASEQHREYGQFIDYRNRG
ncbi:transcriptional regulator [Neobacillus piezotolerans]|uniref:Transcriptional regulator n=1 Tax=Neobacillus piezotolerans TaxID=2259171 RepID=A0A3D8GM58_9BACI|nr:competence protein ComK [Neobacillus piezotolerans]RDU35513.1 transcriptional regulator [Neobacillus piezotolerans]